MDMGVKDTFSGRQSQGNNIIFFLKNTVKKVHSYNRKLQAFQMLRQCCQKSVFKCISQYSEGFVWFGFLKTAPGCRNHFSLEEKLQALPTATPRHSKLIRTKMQAVQKQKEANRNPKGKFKRSDWYGNINQSIPVISAKQK